VLNARLPGHEDIKSPSPNSATTDITVEEAINPGNDFVAPASSFFFAPEPQRSSFMSYLPSKNVSDRLMAQYWSAVHLMCRVVHRPSFQRQYAVFWQQVQAGIEPPPSFQALLLATMFSSITSMSEDAVLMQFGVEKKQLVDSFQTGTETALYRANFLRTTKLQTLQALVMYLVSELRIRVCRTVH
jgi:hypothetical protein